MEDENKMTTENEPCEGSGQQTVNTAGENEIILLIRSFFSKIRENKQLLDIAQKTLFAFSVLLFALMLLFIFLFIIPALQELPGIDKTRIIYNSELKNDAGYKKQISQITRDVQRLSRKFNGYTSGQSYLVINTTDNRFHLYRNKKLIREGFCSSGSYKMLQTLEGRSWIFKTPKGKFWIQGKTTNPTWRKPDWAFVEEGLPIPPPEHHTRYEYGVLGDYALALGDGYLIHGTLYKRFLGMPVTHGCVRLNDEDLKAIFNTLSIGSKVYIF